MNLLLKAMIYLQKKGKNMNYQTESTLTIKGATSLMLTKIKGRLYAEKEWKVTIKDKEIAQMIGITAASYSRLITGVVTPKIMTWIKIVNLYKKYFGEEETTHIIKRIEDVSNTDLHKKPEQENKEVLQGQ